MRKPLSYLALAAVLSMAPGAFAQVALRCGNVLVNVGDTKVQVLSACGEPDFVDGNRWYYETEQTKLLRVVVFNDAGVVTAIQRGR